ncbi:MAG: hypothetical protein OEU26_21060, partial [Candidatus Tectomicrobia bacterium]|nr:hypothetical protein [Candidatus Tectomicrobia bacterium]
SGPFYQFIQRLGERPEDWKFKAFLATTDRDEAEALSRDYPKRWHIEIFQPHYDSSRVVSLIAA